MLAHDIPVVGIDHGRFRRTFYQLLRMLYKKLIQGVFSGHQNDSRFTAAAPHPSAALPGRHDRPRISHQDTKVETADIDPQFQGTGGYNRQQITAGKSFLDVSALLW